MQVIGRNQRMAKRGATALALAALVGCGGGGGDGFDAKDIGGTWRRSAGSLGCEVAGARTTVTVQQADFSVEPIDASRVRFGPTDTAAREEFDVLRSANGLEIDVDDEARPGLRCSIDGSVVVLRIHSAYRFADAQGGDSTHELSFDAGACGSCQDETSVAWDRVSGSNRTSRVLPEDEASAGAPLLGVSVTLDGSEASALEPTD